MERCARWRGDSYATLMRPRFRAWLLVAQPPHDPRGTGREAGALLLSRRRGPCVVAISRHNLAHLYSAKPPIFPNEKAPRLNVRLSLSGHSVPPAPHAGALAELHYAPLGRGIRALDATDPHHIPGRIRNRTRRE